MSLPEILENETGSIDAGSIAGPPTRDLSQVHKNGSGLTPESEGAGRKESLLSNLPGVTYGERRTITVDDSNGETSREQLLGAMVAGAEAGAQYVVDNTPEPIPDPLSTVGANVIAGAAKGVVEQTATDTSFRESCPDERTGEPPVAACRIDGVTQRGGLAASDQRAQRLTPDAYSGGSGRRRTPTIRLRHTFMSQA